METVSRPHPVAYRPWLLGTLAVAFLAACGGPPPADPGPAPDDDSIEVGYGEIDRDQATGNVSTMESDEKSTNRPLTLVEMLSRVPGVQVSETPGGGYKVRIRGSSSFLGSEDPLFVIDGMQIPDPSGVLRGINPSDIESITVLKDAGETAVFGIRGANGVIILKMKKATSG